MGKSHLNDLATYDAGDHLLETVQEWVNPHTRAVAEKDAFAWQLAYDALWRIKVILTEHRVKGDHAQILRSFGDSVGDLAHDWANQWEDGATDYS